MTQVGDLLDNKYDFSKPTFTQLMAANLVFKSISDDAKINDKKKESKQNDWLKIAYEIQNPLNFVNNYSEVKTGLLEEFKIERNKVDRDFNAEDGIVILGTQNEN